MTGGAAASGLRVVAAGADTTLQDGGRVGAARYGVPRSGPMDWLHHRLAARLAGVAAGDVAAATALEVGPAGVTLVGEGGTLTVAVAGPDVVTHVDGVAVEGVAVHRVEPGQRLRVEPGPRASWAYVVPVGGLDVPPVLGSTATHARSGLGGTPLSGPTPDGVTLPLHRAAATSVTPLGGRTWRAPGAGPLAILPAPQTHLLDPTARDVLVGGTFRTTVRYDRMGHRLDGPPLRLAAGHDVVSDPIVAGALQVPADGRVFVLTADHQTTGGYVKPAVLTRTALARFVQLRPGAEVRFAWSTQEAARASLRDALTAVERCVRSAPRPSPTSLASTNLIGGVIDGGTVPDAS